MSQAAAKVVEITAESAAAADQAPPATDDAGKVEVMTVQRSHGDLPLPMLMRRVAADYGKSFNQLLGEFVKLGYGPGKLSIEEYFDFRLFDDAALTGADKREFVGLAMVRSLWDEVNYDRSWYGIFNDKLASTTLLGAYGFPVIPIEALFSNSVSLPKPACRILRTAEDLRAFMREPANYPMFGKPMDGLQSLGSMSFNGYDPTSGQLTMVDGRQASLDQVVADVTTNYQAGYLLQKRLIPHAAIRAICGERLATVRIVTINPKSGPEILGAAWKIPAGANAADNFWRSGNLLGTVDLETGRVVRVIRGKGIDQEQVECHPDSGARMVDFELPMWAEAKSLALSGMKVFKSMGMIGWDIAVTDQGPVIVEPNETPDHGLPQIADRRGLLDERFRAFVAERKADFVAMQQKTRRRLREESRKKVQRVSASMGKI